MTYAHDDKNLYLAMYAETSTELDIGGTKLAISQTTEYPNDGRIEVSLNPQKTASFKLPPQDSHLGRRSVCTWKALSLPKYDNPNMEAFSQRPKSRNAD
jgi:hypothetical protein